MDAVHDRVDAEHVDPVPLRLHHRRIVADADEHPGRWWRKAGPDASDQVALAPAADLIWRSQRRGFRG